MTCEWQEIRISQPRISARLPRGCVSAARRRATDSLAKLNSQRIIPLITLHALGHAHNPQSWNSRGTFNSSRTRLPNHLPPSFFLITSRMRWVQFLNFHRTKLFTFRLFLTWLRRRESVAFLLSSGSSHSTTMERCPNMCVVFVYMRAPQERSANAALTQMVRFLPIHFWPLRIERRINILLLGLCCSNSIIKWDTYMEFNTILLL